MTEAFQDKFNRVDGVIGTGYIVPCGQVALFDEAILPVDVDTLSQGTQVLETPLQRTQVFWNGDTLDNPDQVVRAVWGHDNVIPVGVDTPPSFTILARATKDPLLIDLAPPEESPDCFDQAYGVRVTCPVDGSAPILKLVKLTPKRRVPNLAAGTSVEPDGAQVLASVTIPVVAMNIDPDWDETGNYPYRGHWQDMRLRVRRGDDQVVIEAYLNDRYLNNTILSFTDTEDPLWSSLGVPGFEFLSAALSSQPDGASPFAQDALALMRCTLFSVETLKDFRKPVSVQPHNRFTYDRVVDRVILLVEKDGDARYTATNSGSTKRDTYLQFVLEAEADIIRTEGYYGWLRRTEKVFLVDQQSTYELPENVGEIEMVRPGNFVAGPLREMQPFDFHQAIAGRADSGGKPSVYILTEASVNDRPTIRVFPAALVASIDTNDNTDGPFLEIDYYARQVFPSTPSMQIPFVPQQDIDVLIYGAAAHATLLDTDEVNSARLASIYGIKLNALRRKNNRKVSGRQTVMRSAADVFVETEGTRVPLLRATQLQNFLI